MKLSILMPVYNEAATVEYALKRVLDVSYPCDHEVVVVDDGSTDGTTMRLNAVEDEHVKLLVHDRNRGKGAALRTAALNATGDYCVVFDADLEYAPEEIPLLLAPVIAGDAEVVYGSRSFGSHSAYSFWYVLGNKLVTLWANVLFNSYISDLETCYKLLPLPLYRKLGLRSRGFEIEAELTARLLKSGLRPYEVPISYRARRRHEGKKLTSRDGVYALWTLLRIRLFARRIPRITQT